MERVHVYIDESGLSDRYTIIGGVWTLANTEPSLRDRIRAVRSDFNMSRELKWTKVHRSKLEAYKAFADAFFLHPQSWFNCMVIDSSILDYRTFHGGDDELSLYKFYHHLFRYRIQPGYEYLFFMDYRHNRKANRLPDLMKYTNDWWTRQFQGVAPVRSIESRDSKREDLIQLGDVLLGAVNCAWNARAKAKAKRELAVHVCQRAGLKTLRCECRNPKFNIWPWKPSPESVRRLRKKAL